MPQDWTSVEFKSNPKSTIPMTWYGENLWRVELKSTSIGEGAQICATDFSGNKKCITVKE
jgi:hypothetical protein